MTIIKRRNSRTSLPYSRAIDGRPSHNVSSGPGVPPGTKIPGPAVGAAAALPVNCFPQCGHDTASVETCCLHSGHEIRAIRSSFHRRAFYTLPILPRSRREVHQILNLKRRLRPPVLYYVPIVGAVYDRAFSWNQRKARDHRPRLQMLLEVNKTLIIQL